MSFSSSARFSADRLSKILFFGDLSDALAFGSVGFLVIFCSCFGCSAALSPPASTLSGLGDGW
ncbi:MAG: hypothetical protein Q7T18_08335, partial [Sedimentisphaerales bacterium]|nr:hypothetical protein [Sedimentisphaerales bacterium]